MIGKNKPEVILREIVELNPIEFLGICKIVGVDIYEQKNSEESVDKNVDGAPATAYVKIQPRQFNDIWADVCDAIDKMNRVQRRNLSKLVRAATRGGD